MSKIIITRPNHFAGPLQKLLKQHKIDSLIFPTVDIQPVHMDVTISFIDYYLFVSRNAVIYGTNLLPQGSKTLAIGKGTYDALEEAGFKPEFIPQKPYNSEQFLAHPELPLSKKDHIAIIKGVGGRELLSSRLQKTVASISTVNVYQRQISQPSSKLLQNYLKTLEKDCQAIFVNSVETLQNLLSLTPTDKHEILLTQQLVSGSSRVIDAAHEAGFKQLVWHAESTTDKDMTACLLANR